MAQVFPFCEKMQFQAWNLFLPLTALYFLYYQALLHFFWSYWHWHCGCYVYGER